MKNNETENTVLKIRRDTGITVRGPKQCMFVGESLDKLFLLILNNCFIPKQNSYDRLIF